MRLRRAQEVEEAAAAAATAAAEEEAARDKAAAAAEVELVEEVSTDDTRAAALQRATEHGDVIDIDGSDDDDAANQDEEHATQLATAPAAAEAAAVATEASARALWIKALPKQKRAALGAELSAAATREDQRRLLIASVDADTTETRAVNKRAFLQAYRDRRGEAAGVGAGAGGAGRLTSDHVEPSASGYLDPVTAAAAAVAAAAATTAAHVARMSGNDLFCQGKHAEVRLAPLCVEMTMTSPNQMHRVVQSYHTCHTVVGKTGSE